MGKLIVEFVDPKIGLEILNILRAEKKQIHLFGKNLGLKRV